MWNWKQQSLDLVKHKDALKFSLIGKKACDVLCDQLSLKVTIQSHCCLQMKHRLLQKHFFYCSSLSVYSTWFDWHGSGGGRPGWWRNGGGELILSRSEISKALISFRGTRREVGFRQPLKSTTGPRAPGLTLCAVLFTFWEARPHVCSNYVEWWGVN